MLSVYLHVHVSCLLTLVYCGQTVGWNKMPVGTEVGLGPGNIVLSRDPAPPRKKGTAAPYFSAHVYCNQTAGWIRIPLDGDVGLDSGDIVLDGDPAPLHGTEHSSPHFFVHVCCGQTVAHLSNCWAPSRRCLLQACKCAKILFGRRFASDPTGEAYSAPQTP